MRPHQSSQSILKMLLHRRTLSRSTIISFIMLVMMVVVCQGQTGEVLIPLEDQTVILGEEGHFFCQIKGEKPIMRINGIFYSPGARPIRDYPFDVSFVAHKRGEGDEFTEFNITATIEATVKYNETVLECQDETSAKSTAILIIKGGPAQPNVIHNVSVLKKEILLSWPRPFTWESYNITSYHIVCRDNRLYVYNHSIDNTENKDLISATVKLDEGVPDCYKLQCNVTASNALAKSTPAVANISIPSPLRGKPTIQLEKRPLFTEDQKPHVTFCVKLPVLCSFQHVNYTITISNGGGQRLQLKRQFSYRDGYNGSECIIVTVTDGLEDGKGYNVTIFVDGGYMVGNSSSTILTFKPELLGTTQGSADPKFYETRIGIIVIVGVVSVLVILLLILITIIAISYRKRGSKLNSQAPGPIKRTITPMVNNPIYHDAESPVVYEQVRPLRLERFNSISSQSNLDCGINHVPSPTHSSGSRTPTGPFHLNNHPRSPGSTGSSAAFIWPYSTIQQTNAATFDAIEASVANEAQTSVPLPSSTPGDDSYMTMHSVAKSKNINVENDLSRPRCVTDRHGNQYIEC